MLLVVVSLRSFGQIEWQNYSTSFEDTNGLSVGVAIPYNGLANNVENNVVGIAHWNPGNEIKIDSAINAQTKLSFIYDSSDVYFLAPEVNKRNSAEFEYTVLLNNTSVIVPWRH